MFTINFTNIYQVYGGKPNVQSTNTLHEKDSNGNMNVLMFATKDAAKRYILETYTDVKPVENEIDKFIGSYHSMSGGMELFYSIFEIKKTTIIEN